MGLKTGTVEGMGMSPLSTFWHGKKVLVTGHTGFKGSWLSLWLLHMGASVTGLALPPNTTPSLFDSLDLAANMESFFCDIRNEQKLKAAIRAAQPEVIFHLAAQPLVRYSYQHPVETFSTNLMGTVNLLNAVRYTSSTRVAAVITTDKVYSNNEWLYAYRENDPLGGHDPYSASKAACAIAIASYRSSFLAQEGVAVADFRAGNVIGGGDWAEDRLIPDAVRAWQKQETLHLRSPTAVRPWQHVLDPLFGYLVAAKALWNKPTLADSYNFGPLHTQTATVEQVIMLAREAFGTGEFAIDGNTKEAHEAGLLKLDTTKTQAVFTISPKWDLCQSVEKTMQWYAAFLEGAKALDISVNDITSFTDEA